MENILNDATYKLAINRIAFLSSMLILNSVEAEELNKLSEMAMAFEHRKYDFTRSNLFNNHGFQSAIV